MRRMLASLTTLAAATLLALTPSTAAHATTHEHQEQSELTLSWTSLRSGERHVVDLDCDWRPSGSHPTPWHACRELDRADGDPDRIRPDHGPCTLEYDPVHAVITGTWEGRQVQWSKVFSNQCLMERATSNVMRFD